MQLLHRRTGLQRNGDGTGQRKRHVDDRIVRAGEAERRDAVAGPDRIVGQCIGESADASPGLAVGHGVEMGLQLGDGASGCVGDEFDGALAQRGPVGIALHHRADRVGDENVGAAECLADGRIGLGGNELRVVGGQCLESALAPNVASSG